MGKYKYLLKNIGLLTISEFGSKVMSFLLVPLYTSYLTTTEYGTYDICNTTVALMMPILTLNIVDAVMRFSLDKESDKEKVFTIGLKQIVLASVIFVAVIILIWILNVFPEYERYYCFIILMFIGNLLYNLLSQFCRGLEMVNLVAIGGFINSLSFLILNVFFLVISKQGLYGYFVANCMAHLIPIIFYVFSIKSWKYIKLVHSDTDWKETKREMFKYSYPIVFNTISWWINNVSDRYIVTWISGVAANGIYSVAYKVPSVLNVFQTIFNQAWTLSAVKEFKEKNEVFYTQIYSIYNCGMVLVCSVLIALDRVLARLLFAKDFYYAWKYAPFLMISVVFGSLSGMLGGIFSAAKKSKVFAKTTIIGAVINLILNIILVMQIGPMGAAIATMVSYIVVWGARLKEALQIVNMKITFSRDVCSYFVLIIQAIFINVDIDMCAMYSIQFILCLFCAVLYKHDIGELKKSLIGRLKHDRNDK